MDLSLETWGQALRRDQMGGRMSMLGAVDVAGEDFLTGGEAAMSKGFN